MGEHESSWQRSTEPPRLTVDGLIQALQSAIARGVPGTARIVITVESCERNSATILGAMSYNLLGDNPALRLTVR